jgi:hypothetical protein
VLTLSYIYSGNKGQPRGAAPTIFCNLISEKPMGDMSCNWKIYEKNRNLVNAIDWDMTPEEAVRLYLEWGNNWARGNYVIRSKGDVCAGKRFVV